MSSGSKPVQRINDNNDYPSPAIDSDGNSTVYANDILILVDGSGVAPHIPRRGGFVHDPVFTANGSTKVFAHGVPVNFTDNADTCAHLRIGGSLNVFVGDSVDQDTVSNRTMNEIDEEDAVNPGGGDVLVRSAVSSGSVSASEVSAADKPVAGKKDTSAGTGAGVVLSTDCADIHALFPTTENPGVVAPTGDAIDLIPLTANYTVGKLTRKPHVTFDNALRAGTGGLSLENILCNLKLLAVNVTEPVRAQFPNAFITNTWRPAGIGSATSQHPKGMACDIQFRQAAKKDYFTIAQWFRDNLVYDQLLLEYKTTGSGLPWIHVSFNKDSNRKQVLTLLNNKTYSQGLVDLSDT
jgi:hypothetical protein